MKYLVTIAVFLLGFGYHALSQDNPAPTTDVEYIDVLYMKDGSEFRGQILKYNVEESVKIRLLGGQEITFQAKRIKKIVQECLDCENVTTDKVQKVYSFREKGIYNFTSVSSFNSINEFQEVTLGLSLNHVVGYQFNRFIGLGAGSGYENFTLGNPLSTIPLYAEARGYILKSNGTPYYSINAGVGFPVKRDEANIIGGSPGLLFYPAFGYRVGGARTSFVVDVGYKIQKVTYKYRPTWEVERLEHHTFRRLTIRLGILF